jgi:hypothetical protein
LQISHPHLSGNPFYDEERGAKKIDSKFYYFYLSHRNSFLGKGRRKYATEKIKKLQKINPAVLKIKYF